MSSSAPATARVGCSYMYGRVQILTTWLSQGRWWLQNLFLRHITKHICRFLSCFVRVCLQSLQKVLIWSKKFILKNAIWVSKNAKFEADFESVGKVANRIMRKKLSAKKWPKNGIFDFFTVCKSFRPITSLEWLFAYF
jgi:hypothetical protein